jgi:hypothetical protein
MKFLGPDVPRQAAEARPARRAAQQAARAPRLIFFLRILVLMRQKIMMIWTADVKTVEKASAIRYNFIIHQGQL